MLAYLFVLFAVAVRFLPFAGPMHLLPHAWHFTPLGASLLFFGARGSRRQMWFPLVLFVAADVVLTRFAYSYPLSWDHLVTWTWYGAMLWLGSGLCQNATPLRVVGAALACSASFFLISNFAVWAAWPQMYPRGLNGLMMSYAAGLPFFRGTLASDLLFTTAMFAAPVIIQAFSDWLHKSADDHIAAA